MNETEYFAIIGRGRTKENPSGLARRKLTREGPLDEALRRDLTWEPDTAIVEWEQGDVGASLVEISADEAARLIERFRAKWAEEG